MSNEQIRKDLRNNFREKLRNLVLDTIDRFDTAGLEPSEGISTLVSEMASASSMLLMGTSITPQKFGALMEVTLTELRAKHQEKHGMKFIEIELLHPNIRSDVFGILPDFLDPNDPRPAREQFNERYAHGGGWSPSKGWQLLKDNSLYYSASTEEGEDPLHKPLAQMRLRKELIVIYDHAWVAIIQPDRTFEVSRMD